MRTVVRVVVAIALALWLMTLVPQASQAMSNARLSAAHRMAGYVGDSWTFAGADDDFAYLLQAYDNAHVNTSQWTTRQDLTSAANAINDLGRRPPDGPAPGDFFSYQPFGADSAPLRLGMFVSANDVVVLNTSSHHFEMRLRTEITGDAAPNNHTGFGSQGSFRAYRLPAPVWPGGVDDLSTPPGRVSLVDPAEAVRNAQYAQATPHDPDHGFWHRALGVAADVLAAVSAFVAKVLGSVLGAIGWVLSKIPVINVVVAAVVGLLGTAFDGSGIHRVLTAIVGAPFFVAGWVGDLLGAAHVPLLPGVFHGISSFGVGAAGFMVTIVTGIEANGQSTFGGVAISLIGDALFFIPAIKGAQIGARVAAVLSRTAAGRLTLVAGARSLTVVAPFVERIGSVAGLASRAAMSPILAPATARLLPALRSAARGSKFAANVAEHLGDLVTLKPSAWADTGRGATQAVRSLSSLRPFRALRGPGSHAVGDVMGPRTARQTLRAVLPQAADTVALAWRPASAVRQTIGQAAHLSKALAHDVTGGFRNWPTRGLGPVVRRLPPRHLAHVEAGAGWVAEFAVPKVEGVLAINRSHAGAAAVGQLAAGHGFEQLPEPPRLRPHQLVSPIPATEPEPAGWWQRLLDLLFR